LKGVFRGIATFVALALVAPPVAAQGVRGVATTSSRFVELRGLRADTLAEGQLTVDASGRVIFNGRAVPCVPDVPCVVYGAGEREQGLVVTQDIRLTAWGLGARGLSATAFVRARAQAGDFAWPRAEDAFDALIAYVEYDRAPFRARLGRQIASGGLGFSSFDGASVRFESGALVSGELYGGRSLARGVYEPRSEVLQAFEDFVPDPTVLLFGGAVDARPFGGVDVSLRYQREIFSDRSGLASERASAEAVISAFAPVSIVAATDYDFAFGRFGRTDLRARFPLSNGFSVEARARRYVPYFELWTIWGFFDPVAWKEAEAALGWQAGTGFGAFASVSIRRYDETGTAIFGPPLERDTRRYVASGWWQVPGGTWRLDGSFRHESGAGASYGGGDVAGTWRTSEGTSLRAWLTRFEQVEEFRVGEGHVLGGGIDGSWRVNQRWSLEGGAGLYHHSSTRIDSPDWNQRRAWLSLRLEFGDDPGLRARPLQ
jgi:hypothetical protein